MKSTRINLLAILTIVALGLSSFVPVAIAAKNKPVLTKKELKVLLKTASEPADHQKIAEYYRQKAFRLRADAKEHLEMAEDYAKNPRFAAMGPKQLGSLGQGASHCQRWAQLDEQEAKEAEALAVLHEDMAKQAEQKQH